MGRLPLTKMVLHRYNEMMKWEHEWILCYHGIDEEYVAELEKIVEFSHIAMGDCSQGEILNKGHEACKGNMFMLLENDWWWGDSSCIEKAFKVFESCDDVHVIRLLQDGIRNINGSTREVSGLEMFEIGGYFNKFHFNPQIRTIQYPSGEFAELSNIGYLNLEGVMNQRWNEGYRSWCTVNDYFNHIGVFAEHYRICPEEFKSKNFTMEDVYNLYFYGKRIRDHGFKGIYKELFDEYILEAINIYRKPFRWV